MLLIASPLMAGPLPPDCERILIVGAGGFGREVLQWAIDAWPDRANTITGFLAEDNASEKTSRCALPIVAKPSDFRPGRGDYLVFGIGVPKTRIQVANALVEKGCRFLTVVHPTAIISPTASIAAGTIICPHAVVSDSASVGQFVVVNYFSSIAHDAYVGDFTVMSPYSAVAGNARVGHSVFFGIHSGVAPGVEIGEGSRISSHSWARASVPAGSLVHGNPPVISPLIALEQ